jgi:hypothetical protein
MAPRISFSQGATSGTFQLSSAILAKAMREFEMSLLKADLASRTKFDTLA